MAKKIEAFFDEEGDYASANTNFVYDSAYSLYCLTSILNSNLLTTIYGGYFGALIMSGGYFQFQAPQLRVLPIRRISFTTPAPDRTRLLAEGKELYKTSLATNNVTELLSFVSTQLSVTRERSDVIHDLLAFLAEQMIEMNKEKQIEIKGFITWLEREIGVKVDDLNNKTKLRAYHEHDLKTLLDILHQNRSRLHIDPHSRSFQESFEHELTNSMNKLTPLKSRISATDHLIDQIVYRLYGLTEEEIKIIEGHFD